MRNKASGILSKIKNHMFWIIVLLLVPLFIYSKNIISTINTQVSKMLKGNQKPYKVVVFDLDETIGCFIELSMFWNALEYFYGHNLFSDKFFELLDIFPEFFRPSIFQILDFIHKKKINKGCNKIMIYTNNQNFKDWVKMISDYIDLTLGYKVFDNIITAYKVNGKQIESKRTSHEKSVADLIRCTDIPADSEICFIDDLYHPLMDKENVFYINIKPYTFSMSFNEMSLRYYNLVLNKNKNAPLGESDFVNIMVSYLNQYNYAVKPKTELEEKTDVVVSKKLLSHLEDFLKRERMPITRKKRLRRKKTLKHLVK